MSMYRCTATAKFYPGQVLHLEPAQIARRAHNLDIPQRYDGKTPIKVTAKAPIEFKAGERIGLDDLPRSMVGILVPMGEPRSEEDKIAVAKEAERKAAAAAAKPKKTVPPVLV